MAGARATAPDVHINANSILRFPSSRFPRDSRLKTPEKRLVFHGVFVRPRKFEFRRSGHAISSYFVCSIIFSKWPVLFFLFNNECVDDVAAQVAEGGDRGAGGGVPGEDLRQQRKGRAKGRVRQGRVSFIFLFFIL